MPCKQIKSYAVIILDKNSFLYGLKNPKARDHQKEIEGHQKRKRQLFFFYGEYRLDWVITHVDKSLVMNAISELDYVKYDELCGYGKTGRLRNLMKKRQKMANKLLQHHASSGVAEFR